MLMFETNMELFKNKNCKINPNKLDNLQTEIIKNTKKKIATNNQCLCEGFLTKINIWVYNPSEISSKNWSSFYSRREFHNSSDVVNLCIDSIIKHSNETYNVRVFNQSSIKNLLPEFTQFIDKCKNSYSFHNLLKYAILYKYGGIWIPKDTIMLNKLVISESDYYSGKVLTFGINNTNIIDNAGISDNIIASNRHNPVIKNVLKFITNNTSRFQNSYKFKRGINKFFNKLIRKGDYIRFYQDTLQKDFSGKFIKISEIMSIFNNNIVDYKDKIFFNVHVNRIRELPKYSYLLRMSRSQIINSNLFISKLFKFSNRTINNIVHCGDINGANI